MLQLHLSDQQFHCLVRCLILEVWQYHMVEYLRDLTHWGRVTHICVSKRTIIGSDNGLSPSRRQSIIWTNAGILLIGQLETIFSENLIEIHKFSFKKMRLKVSSAKWRSFCLGLNVLMVNWGMLIHYKGRFQSLPLSHPNKDSQYWLNSLLTSNNTVGNSHENRYNNVVDTKWRKHI